MSIKDMPCVTVEQVLALREAAIKLEKELADANERLKEGVACCYSAYFYIADEAPRIDWKAAKSEVGKAILRFEGRYSDLSDDGEIHRNGAGFVNPASL